MFTETLFRLVNRMYIQMAQQERREAAEFHVGIVQSDSKPSKDSSPPYYGNQTSEGVCLITRSFAEASTTEEPDAGKLHVRVCTGGAGKPAFLP